MQAPTGFGNAAAAHQPPHAATRTPLALSLIAAVGCTTPAAPPAPIAPGASQASGPAGDPAAGAVPELYGAGLFSTGAWDFFLAFTADQRRVLFCRADDSFERYEILETRLDDHGQWTPPVHPAFATRWSNADPHISPDGRRVFFISNRPFDSDAAREPVAGTARDTYDIWVASLGADGAWGEAEHLPAPVNDPSVDEWSPAVAASGNLYFGSDRPGTRGGTDLWRARLVDGVYQPIENLGDAINTAGLEVEPWISPDERTLIFSALRRGDSLGGYDLYISRQRDGGWTSARRLPAPINGMGGDFNQSVSPDGRWLYYSSARPLGGALGPRFDQPRDDAKIRGIGNARTGDIYRVPMAALDAFAP